MPYGFVDVFPMTGIRGVRHKLQDESSQIIKVTGESVRKLAANRLVEELRPGCDENSNKNKNLNFYSTF